MTSSFRQLHADGILLLANAWDAGSARLIESLGARAIATTSAGMAWTHGYPDGDSLPTALLLASVKSIARVLKVPLSVNIEAGYASEPTQVAALVAALLDVGVVGINLEDGTDAPALLCRKIEAVREMATRRSADVFVNARTDVFLKGLVAPEQRLAETLARAALYRAAGADGLFAPRVAASADIAALVSAVGLPLNVLAGPGMPSAPELAQLGVRRLSAGSLFALAAMGRTAPAVEVFLGDGSFEPLPPGALTYPALNALMVPPPR